jgi:hypothetical protein
MKPGTGDGKMGTGEGERDWKTDFFFPTEERPDTMTSNDKGYFSHWLTKKIKEKLGV